MNPILSQNSQRYCNSMPLGVSNFHDMPGKTSNQILAGTANPRTLVKPTIVAPIAELSYWRTNPSVTMSQINSRTLRNPQGAGFNSTVVQPRQCAVECPSEVEICDPLSYVPLQPNVYSSTNVFTPINATNGIAIVPEFPNTTLVTEATVNGYLNRLYLDTNLAQPSPQEMVEHYTSMGSSGRTTNVSNNAFCESRQPVQTTVSGPEPSLYTVYDPRFSGYGSSNRSYLDPQLGQQKYFYDDIDAVRFPSYITRNKLDSCLTPYGDAYGKLESGDMSLAQARPMAEQSFVDNSLAFRNDMMKHLMRKRNEEMVQVRTAPKMTMRQWR